MKVWPLAVMMVTILLVVLGLHSVANKKEDWNLSCDGTFYEPDKQDETPRTVKLTFVSQDGHAVIGYDYFRDDHFQGGIRLFGKIVGFEVSSLSLHVRVTKGEVLSDISKLELPSYLQKILDENMNFLSRLNEGMLFTLKMSEMDLKQGYAILNFDPGNNIWACKVKAD
ncbi:MAG: hypothetical protein LPD71_11200 [Shewanella sp.]|nr:hypothetical protein [Shewanella sp.]MCF1432012.1 hypothetical protein [Shewanella sp.]MCF1439278.1 hypothetical protein [Shewanella sp.]MCF1459636.1 hypothetical protein [Shewanella sp.]